MNMKKQTIILSLMIVLAFAFAMSASAVLDSQTDEINITINMPYSGTVKSIGPDVFSQE